MGVIPGLVIGIIVLLFLVLYLKVPIDGTSEKKVCDKDDKHCENKDVSNKQNILIYILLPLVIGIVVGGSIYKLRFMIKNPKTGMLIVGTNMMRHSITGR